MHVVTVTVMLVVLIPVTMACLIYSMKIKQKNLPLPEGFQMHKASLCKKQSSNAMPIPISMSSKLWTHSSLHHEYMLLQIFQHATVTGQSSYKHAIHWSQREPSTEWDLLAEPTTTELVSPNSQCQDIEALYCDVYQLCRLPS